MIYIFDIFIGESHSKVINSNSDEPLKMSKKESSYTMLTVISCAVFIVGNFLDSFTIIATIFSLDVFVKYGFLIVTGNALFFASHSVHFFVYYKFNKVFRNQFNSFLLKLR